MTSSSRASRADEKPALSGLIAVLLSHKIPRVQPLSSFRGGAQRRARNPFSRGRCSWIPGCLAALGPRNDEILQCKADVEVTPVGIALLDQSDLPIASPFLISFSREIADSGSSQPSNQTSRSAPYWAVKPPSSLFLC